MMKTKQLKIKSFKLKPNLENYEKTYKTFQWKNYHSELSWFKHGKINAAYNAVTKHALSDNKDKIALHWINEKKEKQFSFSDLDQLSNKFANVLKKLGIKKGERIFIFLPRIPELYITFLGILKTGAIAGTMFQAFGPDGLRDRLKDSRAKFLITDSVLAKRVYKIKKDLPNLQKIIIINKQKAKRNKHKERGAKRGEISYHSLMSKAPSEFKIKKMNPESPAFMLYTSGTTGKPKGVIHSHQAILQQHLTAKWILDLKENDIYWCTADPGWVTGISYGILGNLSNGITSLAYNGKFSPEKWYSIIEKYKVSVWYR